jgi:K+-transporting ATPase c subunit
MRWGVTMSISKYRGRRRPLIAWSSRSTCHHASTPIITIIIIIIALTMLLTGSGFVLLISPTLMVSALAQEEGITTIISTTTTEASPPPPGIEALPQSNLSFSEIPVSEVNGTYMNPDIGFRIDLPTGWQGIEINFLINSVIVAPGETNPLESLALQEPATFMTIMGIDQEGFNMLESIVSQFPALEGGQEGGGTSLPPAGGGSSSSGPLGTTTTATPFGDSAITCTFSQPSFVTIRGINAEERTGECTDSGQGIAEGGGVGTNAPKTKSYTFATQNNSLIVVGFFSNSTSTYDQNLPLFEGSVRTISISQPADIATSEIYNRYKQLVEMQQQQQQQLLLLSNQTGSGGGM